jgi:hypothetical protein
VTQVSNNTAICVLYIVDVVVIGYGVCQPDVNVLQVGVETVDEGSIEVDWEAGVSVDIVGWVSGPGPAKTVHESWDSLGGWGWPVDF